MTNRIIAIDGTAASGKGTLARRLAAAMGLPHLDTGKLYRYVGYLMLARGFDPEDEVAAVTVAQEARRDLDQNLLQSEELMSDAAGQAASKVAAIPEVRRVLFDMQRDFATQPGGAVLDGRDICTVICPEAVLKLYVDASLEARAQRRHKELQNRGVLDTYDAVLATMRERDARDKGRADAPLKPAEDAVIIDTTEMNADQAFEFVVALARQRLGTKQA